MHNTIADNTTTPRKNKTQTIVKQKKINIATNTREEHTPYTTPSQTTNHHKTTKLARTQNARQKIALIITYNTAKKHKNIATKRRERHAPSALTAPSATPSPSLRPPPILPAIATTSPPSAASAAAPPPAPVVSLHLFASARYLTVSILRPAVEGGAEDTTPTPHASLSSKPCVVRVYTRVPVPADRRERHY